MKNLNFAKIILAYIFLSSVCVANDKGLFELFTMSPSYENVSSFLEDVINLDNADIRTNVAIKPVEESGEIFTGYVTLNDKKVESVALWTSNERIPAKDARVVFAKVSKKIASIMGEGTLVENIPNHEDASEVRMDSYIWKDKEDIIVLMISEYPSRAGISLSRQAQSTWLENMGADSGAFWEKTLQPINQAIAPNSTEGNNFVEKIPDENDGNSVQNQVPINPSNIEGKSSLESGNAVNKFPWIITFLISLILIFIVIVFIKKKQ